MDVRSDGVREQSVAAWVKAKVSAPSIGLVAVMFRPYARGSEHFSACNAP